MKAGRSLDKISVPGLAQAKSEGTNPVAAQTTDFNRASSYVPNIGKADTFVEQAFKLSKAHESAKEVFESNGMFYAIRLKSREDADMGKFEAEKESIKSSLLFPRKRAFMQQYLADLKARAKIVYNKSLMKEAEVEI